MSSPPLRLPLLLGLALVVATLAVAGCGRRRFHGHGQYGQGTSRTHIEEILCRRHRLLRGPSLSRRRRRPRHRRHRPSRRRSRAVPSPRPVVRASRAA